ncbi:putative membrane protein [Pseudomonas syringae pv. avii]|uniref:Membrane protein n=1 Tax=Pseudomonas syringae pv. avii TaxID=663959 RepID=A0ABY1U281_PSESX|nr:putative membrane protein [Pseudomonas syringae pv. avii]
MPLVKRLKKKPSVALKKMRAISLLPASLLRHLRNLLLPPSLCVKHLQPLLRHLPAQRRLPMPASVTNNVALTSLVLTIATPVAATAIARTLRIVLRSKRRLLPLVLHLAPPTKKATASVVVVVARAS